MILRAEKKGNYTLIPNELLLDDTISDKARGTLVRLLARPDNWNPNIRHLVKTGKDGHAAMRSSLLESEKAGYIQKDVARHANGRIIGMEYIVRESRSIPFSEPVPESDQPTNSCKEMEIPREVVDTVTQVVDVNTMVEMQEQTCEEITLPEPDHQVNGSHLVDMASRSDLEQAPVTPEPDPSPVVDQDSIDQVKESYHAAENRETETAKRESAPIINTDIKQILRLTTTTRAREAEPVLCDQAIPLPSSYSSNAILNLVPEKHRSPMVISLVNKAVVDYPELEVEEAIAYAAGNVRGGSMQFKAYLDKTLKNKWAVGYLESMQEQNFHGGYGAAWVHPMAKYPNGTVTGCPRMDTNYMVAADFLMEMGVDVNQMCAEA